MKKLKIAGVVTTLIIFAVIILNLGQSFAATETTLAQTPGIYMCI